MNTVLTFLQHNRQRLDLERYGVPSKLSCVVVTPRFRASSHVVFLILPHGQADPVLVAKMPRLAGVSGSIEREVANLRAVQASRAGGFDSIPRVIAFEEYNGRSILVETALIGQPMDPATVRRDFTACCQAVTNWLTEVQLLANGSSETAPTWFGRLVEQPFRYFEEVFPLSAKEARLLEQTWELVAPLRQANLPLVFEHNDLSHPNVMRLKDGKLGVVDWEQAEPRGLPASDLFFFLTYAAFARHKARANGGYLPAFQSAFFGRAAWARPYVGVYVERLALPLSALTSLFVLSWLRYMTSLLIRLGDTQRPPQRFGPETAAWLRANRYYALWQHAVTHVNELDWYDLPQVKARSI
jgi:aminoglycoside phosphotransferase